MFCKNCGKEIEATYNVCPYCGTPQQAAPAPTPTPAPAPTAAPAPNAQADGGSFGWGVLGFCFPIVGLILFLVWKDSKPKSGKVAGIGAIIGFGISVLLYIIGFVAGAAGSYMYY